MSAPTDRNRLDEEASAYLLQHADNPVHWQPWDEDALAAARERDVPIFLSVGYSACHWCHVMEEESFVDDAVAERLNEDFVPIKVDREERPDLDSVYQTACQLVSGRGGWPLSAFCTPEGEPFHVGTYFPRQSRGGMPGFLDVLEDVSSSWSDPDDREQLERRAGQLTSRIRAHLEDVPEAPDATGTAEDAAAAGDSAASEEPATAILGAGTDRERTTPADGASSGSAPSPGDAPADEPGPVERAASAAVRRADGEHGGWGSGPKFPQPRRIDVLLDAAEATGEDTYRDVAVGAAAAMVDGGLYDHVGGGFHRYCTDRDWTVPHFEKMLYDNAEIPRVLLDLYQVTGRERFATAARETFAFLERELAQPDGGFASTLDARSPVPAERTDSGAPGEDEEGAFYVWTPAEVADALAEPESWFEDAAAAADVGDADDVALPDADALADLVCERFGITEAGNFEGYTVLTIETSLQDLAAERDLELADVRALLEVARQRMHAVREERPRPRRDEKVIAAWNGLAIRALAEGSLVLGEEHLAERARAALTAVRERLWDGERLARRYVLAEDDVAATDEQPVETPADVSGDGYLEDHAFLGRGALACYEATGDVDALAFALELADAIVADFYDEQAGTLYVTPAGGESLIARPQEPMDQSTPSSLAVAADLLAALDAFVPHDRYADVAERVLRTHAGSLEGQPLQHPSLALAAERLRSGSTEVTLAVGDGSPAAAADWRDWLAETHLPRRLLAPRPATDDVLEEWLDALGVDDVPPVWAGRGARDGATGYVCRGYTCSRPLDEPAAAAEWLGH